jgi:glycosyltransferase involved in cell wall biosynthesis
METEIVLADPEIIRQYAKKFPEKIELHQFSNNVGAISNFSRLAKLSKNNYIMFCDQDDIWLPGKIEMTLNKIKEMESQFGQELPLLVHTI